MDHAQLFLLFVAVLSTVTIFFRPTGPSQDGGLMYPLSVYQFDEIHSPAYENVPIFVPTYMEVDLPAIS